MTTYNPNDFYPRSGVEIDSNGNAKNDADGLGTDGSRLIGYSDGTAVHGALGNVQGTLLTNQTRSAPINTAVQNNLNARGILLTLDVTQASGTGGLRVYTGISDPVTGKTVFLNPDPTTVTAVGTYVYELYPGSTGTATNVLQRVSGTLPKSWLGRVMHLDSSNYTYSLGYSLIL